MIKEDFDKLYCLTLIKFIIVVILLIFLRSELPKIVKFHNEFIMYTTKQIIGKYDNISTFNREIELKTIDNKTILLDYIITFYNISFKEYDKIFNEIKLKYPLNESKISLWYDGDYKVLLNIIDEYEIPKIYKGLFDKENLMNILFYILIIFILFGLFFFIDLISLSCIRFNKYPI
jgi:hypothetical protein